MRGIFKEGKIQVLDSLGDPVSGAKLTFYATGTANLQNTFSDYERSATNANPVVCDSEGRAIVFLSKNIVYDYTITDSNDAAIYAKFVKVESDESPLTTKGDIAVYGTADDRLPVGTDGYYLVADSSQALGVKWATGGTDTTLTTKGDLYTYDTANARLAVGNDDEILVADSSQTTGLAWIALPKAGAYLSSNQSLTQSTWTKIVFDTEEFDTASAFATGTFTAPVAGYYEVTTAIQVDNLTDQAAFDLAIYKNGTAFKQIANEDASKSAELLIGGSALMDLAASDTIDIYLRIELTGKYASGGQTLTWVQMTRVA